MITEKEIEILFKNQLDNIKDQTLRKSVVKTWVLACEQGNWKSLDELKKIPFTLLVDTHGIDLIEHTVAVTEGAVALGKTQVAVYKNPPYRIDFDRLYAGGLLHDVGKLLEYEPDGSGWYRKSLSGKYARHPISGAVIAAECNVPEDVRNIIICHSKEGEGRPQVVEAVFVHQVDFATFNPLLMKQNGLLIEV